LPLLTFAETSPDMPPKAHDAKMRAPPRLHAPPLGSFKEARRPRGPVEGWDDMSTAEQRRALVYRSVDDSTLRRYASYVTAIREAGYSLWDAQEFEAFVISAWGRSVAPLLGVTLRGYKAAMSLAREAADRPLTLEEDARINQLLRRCVAADITKYRGADPPRRGSITRDVAKLLESAATTLGQPKWALVIRLLSTLGLRCFQLKALAPADVDDQAGAMNVLRKATRRQRVKSGAWETLPIPTQEGMDTLRVTIALHRKAGRPDHEPLVDWDADRLNAFVTTTLQRELRIAGNVVFDGAHCFRHGVAVQIAWQKGVEEARVLQGWRSLGTASGYAALGRAGRLKRLRGS